MKKINRFLRILGPGLITGAADDDPSGIATYTQTGARFGYGQLWTTLYILPFMIAVQEACARIGAVTGRGIAAVVKENYSKKVLYFVVCLILVTNTINIGADLGAMAASLALIIPIHYLTLTLIITLFILVLEIFTSYKVYSRILKLLVLFILAYPISIFVIKAPWAAIIKATLLPHLEFNFSYLFIIVGVFGTTISPYMFFWEASEEVEEEKEKRLLKLNKKPEIDWNFIRKIRIDNSLGMIVSQIATWCIIVVAGTVFYNQGVKNIESVSDAAASLEPLVQSFPNSGFLAKVLFASGIVGLGLLAVPVLSGSAAYAVSEALNWKEGLNVKFKRAHGFYGVIIFATLIGLLMNFLRVNPIKALVFTAVFNGVASVPLLFLIAKIASHKKIMGEYKSGLLSTILLWTTFIVMLIAVIIMLSAIWS